MTRKRAMGAHRPSDRKALSIKVPNERGKWRKIATGSRDDVTVRGMADAVRKLGPLGKRAYDILDGITGKDTLLAWWATWCATPPRSNANGAAIEPSIDERILHVRAEAAAVNLVPLLGTWYEVNTAPKSELAEDTADHYRSAVRAFVMWYTEVDTGKAKTITTQWKKHFPKSTIVLTTALTETTLATYIDEMDDVEAGTVRKRAAGLSSFTAWLKLRGKIAVDPMLGVKLPPAGKPLTHYVVTDEAMLLADAQEGQYRLYSALLHGTGIEVTVALGLRRRHVNTDTKEIEAAGTKTYNRRRIARVAEWAWPYVLDACKGKHPDALLFDEIPDRWIAADRHNEAVDALIARGYERFARDDFGNEKRYTMRDARHTWAVRACASGWPVEIVATQLGHKDGVLAHRVYGRFVPNHDERDRWEAIATARDEALRKEREKPLHIVGG